eukprot:1143240-Pelagomonas_calceolata.AAC.10
MSCSAAVPLIKRSTLSMHMHRVNISETLETGATREPLHVQRSLLSTRHCTPPCSWAHMHAHIHRSADEVKKVRQDNISKSEGTPGEPWVRFIIHSALSVSEWPYPLATNWSYRSCTDAGCNSQYAGGCRKATTGHCTCASTHLQHCGSAGKERRKCRMGQLQVHLEIGWKDAPTLFPEVICACAMICHRVPFVAASLPYSGVPTP